MKISCTQENINIGLGIVSHIAGRNANLPILSNILIKAEDKLITLSSTNLEIGVTTQIRGKIEAEGEFSVDAKLLSSYISLLPKERVDIELINEEIKIECQKQKTKIKGQLAVDFPLIPKLEKNNPYLVEVKAFKAAVSETIFAAANSEARPEISGIFLSFNNDQLVMAATDSYRLAEAKIALLEGNKNESSIIVPVRTLQEVFRIINLIKEDSSSDNVENLEIYISDNQIMFSYNGVDLISRLIEGQYPDYTQIIPNSWKSRVKIDVSGLIKAVKSSSLFTRSGIYDVKLDFNMESKGLVIYSSSSQTGENYSNMEVEIEGGDENVVLNYRYLLDGLQNINSQYIYLEITDSSSPIILKPIDRDNYLYIIMPIRQ